MKKFDAVAFGKAAKTKRVIELNLGVREVAQKLGVSASTVSRIENGKGGKSDINTIFTVCSWLRVSVCDFIVNDKKRKPDL